MSFSNSLLIKGRDAIYVSGYNYEDELISRFSNEITDGLPPYGEDQNTLRTVDFDYESKTNYYCKVCNFFPELSELIKSYESLKFYEDYLTEDEFNERKNQYKEEFPDEDFSNYPTYSEYLSRHNKYIYYLENKNKIINDYIFKRIYKVVSFRNSTFIIFNTKITLPNENDLVNKYRINESKQIMSNVITYGNIENCQLGNNSTNKVAKDNPIGYYFDSLVKDISTGYYHSLFLTETGKVYTSGKNNKGQLGVTVEETDFQDISNNTLYVAYPKLVEDLPLIKKIRCGSVSSYLIDINNNLWVCGDNVKGELGLGDTKNRYKFVKVDYLKDIVDIVAGDGFAIALDIYGDVYVTGYNGLYQLGIDDKLDRNKFTKIEYLDDKIKRIYCDTDYTILLSDKNSLLCAGNGTYGQFGSDKNLKKYIKTFTKITEVQDVKDVYTMQSSLVALLQNNNLFGSGENSYGELGIGSNTTINEFTQLNLYNPYTFTFDETPTTVTENIFTQHYDI